MPEFENEELRRRYALIIGGQCPSGHGEVERREVCAWCSVCGMGWSVRGNEITNHFDTTSMQLDGNPGLVTGPGSGYFSVTFD